MMSHHYMLDVTYAKIILSHHFEQVISSNETRAMRSLSSICDHDAWDFKIWVHASTW